MLAPTKLTLSGERFRVTYQIVGTRDEVMRKAEEICIEQTVEFPADLVPDNDIRAHIFGRVESIAQQAERVFHVQISYAIETAGLEITQFLNVVFGNTSMQPDIQVADLALPDSLLATYAGPRFGISGLRELLGVNDRPLLCTAIKPMGLPVEVLARMTGDFARGGIDLIKDDHGLADQVFAPFAERVKRCAEAVHEANQRTGRRSIYVANVTAPGKALWERAYLAKAAGAGALMVAPGIVGYDRMQALADDPQLGLPILFHPALLGSFVTYPYTGMAHGVVFGLLGRLAGADVTIFPNFGGRFSFSREACLSIADAARRPLGNLKPIFPAPAGGMRVERVNDMLAFYGMDAVLLIGGDLHRHPDGVYAASQRFLEMVLAGAQRLRVEQGIESLR
jgi:ribulose-bisphosphate carboxylase large chain